MHAVTLRWGSRIFYFFFVLPTTLSVILSIIAYKKQEKRPSLVNIYKMVELFQKLRFEVCRRAPQEFIRQLKLFL
jgi:hypothetical protein